MGFDYTVGGNDKGLTYIFLEQAKKQTGFDGSKKIDWNAVMTVFDKIQEEEKAEGQSLFSGGTDKTRAGWGSSYKIQEGDKISLSDEQMNKIYGAMGLDLSKTKPSKPAEKKVPQKDPNPPKADPNPPQKDTNPPKKETLDSKYTTKTPKYANKSVKQQDGTTVVYDENGYVEEVRNTMNKKYISINRKADGSVDFYEENEYAENGLNTKTIFRNADGTVKYYIEMIYNENGLNRKSIFRKPNGAVEQYTESIYDPKGVNTKNIYRNAAGGVAKYEEYEYDPNNKYARKIHERDKDGNLIEESFRPW